MRRPRELASGRAKDEGFPLSRPRHVFLGAAADDVYVWLDIFCQYQHWLGDVGSERRWVNWDVVFQLTIAAIGRTCFVLSPWKDPVPLRRAWMLWEALSTLDSKHTNASDALRQRGFLPWGSRMRRLKAAKQAMADATARLSSAKEKFIGLAGIGQRLTPALQRLG